MGIPATVGISSHQINENFLLSFFPPHLREKQEELSEADATENEMLTDSSSP